MDPITEEVRCKAQEKMENKGIHEGLRGLLHDRLTKSQFNEKVTQLCKDYIKGKNVETLTVDNMIKNVAPEARKLVPDSVRDELLTAIRKVITEDDLNTKNATSA